MYCTLEISWDATQQFERFAVWALRLWAGNLDIYEFKRQLSLSGSQPLRLASQTVQQKHHKM